MALLFGGCSRDETSTENVPPPAASAPAEEPMPGPAGGPAVAFRALGQEPGWLLEIKPDAQMELRFAYGEGRAVTPVPVPEISGRQTIYHAITEANDLRVEIVEESCADVMSGKGYPATVRVTLNGNVFDGCGEYLE